MSILDAPTGWVIEYPEFAKLADQQMHTFWPWDEPEVENDVQDVRSLMTEGEKHGLMTVLKLFTLYEMHAGDDYWSGRVMRDFHRPEIQRMASLFSAVELNSHAPFYNKINELLYIDTEEFYMSYQHDEDLSARMSFIGSVIDSPELKMSLAGFSFVEGAVLYSSFAFLKHFQAQEYGKDLIKNICRGINLSVADEHTHAVGGALLFRRLVEEQGLTNKEEMEVYRMAKEVELHEFAIIDKLFEKGDIAGLCKEDLKRFVQSRVNLCLEQLGLEPVEVSGDCYISSWFYKNINSVQFHDFFTGSGSEYNIKWNEQKFGEVWSE
jgi:ribonucleotide reductase beta subunit family protein with ferritin-like domain